MVLNLNNNTTIILHICSMPVLDEAPEVFQPSNPSLNGLTGKAESKKSSMLRRLLKYALPLPLALVVFFGGLYALDENWCEILGQYGFVLYPNLQHVNGPPPT